MYKTLTGAVCTRHSRGLCAQDTHGGCVHKTLTGVVLIGTGLLAVSVALLLPG